MCCCYYSKQLLTILRSASAYLLYCIHKRKKKLVTFLQASIVAIVSRHIHHQPNTQNYTMGDTVSSLLFQPPAPSKLKEHKIVWLNTSRGTRIPGFYISYRRQGGVESCRSLSAQEIADSRPEDGITLLYSHANAEDLGSIYPWCKFLSKMLQVNLFAYDYTGYGMAMKSGKS